MFAVGKFITINHPIITISPDGICADAQLSTLVLANLTLFDSTREYALDGLNPLPHQPDACSLHIWLSVCRGAVSTSIVAQ